MKLAELRIDTQGASVYASVAGDIDMSNADELRTELGAITPNQALGLILDLTAVRYLDSAGIHLVHRLREDLRASGQRLLLVIPQASSINATIKLAGLDWADDTAESADDARRVLEGTHGT